MPDPLRDSFPGEVRRLLAAVPGGAISEEPLEPLPGEEPRPAAVLMPLYHDADEWHVLLTERTDTMAHHGGQVAFPGGKVDPGDRDRIETALRETWEEIGLPPGQVEVLGVMPDYVTITSFHVTPVVGVIPWPSELTLSTDELTEVFGVPLRWFADPAHLVIEIWDHPRRGPNTPVYFYFYGGHKIWGATARMLHRFIELLGPVLNRE